MIIMENKLIFLVFVLLNGINSIVNGQLALEPEVKEPEGANPPGVDPASTDPLGTDSTTVDSTNVDSTSVDPTGVDPTSADPKSMDPQGAEHTLDFSTPHSSSIDNMQVLRRIKVSGFVYPTASRIIIDLESSGKDCQAKNSQCIIALHLDVRFFEDQILLNTFRSGRWDFNEERTSKIQYLKNGDHEFNIVVLERIFLIMIDNSTTLTYEHRVPISNIKKVYVRGDINLKSVEAKNWECS